MSRWRVYKDPEDRWLRWIAVPAHENWWDKPQGIRFPQWDMALRYANRMNLTANPETRRRATDAEQLSNMLKKLGYEQTTIKDPSGQFCDLNVRFNSRNHIRLSSGDDSFVLAPHEWKPLAGFLFTAAYQEEEA